jgi:predicted DNA-binding protein (MmcQ/YjbR family)
MNKKHWNTILMDGVMAKKMLQDQIDASYKLVVATIRKSKSEQK